MPVSRTTKLPPHLAADRTLLRGSRGHERDRTRSNRVGSDFLLISVKVSVHAFTAPRLITRSRSPWFAVPRQRTRVGTLARRDAGSGLYSLCDFVYFAYINPAIRSRRTYTTGERTTSATAFSHSYVCASRGDRDSSLDPANSRGRTPHANAAYINSRVTSVTKYRPLDGVLAHRLGRN